MHDSKSFIKIFSKLTIIIILFGKNSISNFVQIHLPYSDYGGSYYWDDKLQTFSYSRHYGIGSNFCFLMTVLAILKDRDIYPKKISAYLTNYKSVDLYENSLYIDNEKLIIWKDISKQELTNLYFKTLNCSLHKYGFGFGEKSSDVNFKIITPLLDAFFNFKPNIILHAEKIMNEISFTTDSIFVWWRKTDKITEVTYGYPELVKIKKFLDNKKTVYFQSDDPEIINEIKTFSEFKNIKILNVIPTCNENTGAHEIIYRQGTLQDAETHVNSILALALVASKSKYFIGYPGSISNVICMIKRGFENTVIFKPCDELYTNSKYQL